VAELKLLNLGLQIRLLISANRYCELLWYCCHRLYHLCCCKLRFDTRWLGRVNWYCELL